MAMSRKGRSHLQELLSGTADPESEDSSPAPNTGMAQDESGQASSGSSLTPSMNLQELGTMPGVESLGWFGTADSLHNAFDLETALLSQGQEQFGFSNLTMDEFADQVLKASSNGSNEQESWCEVNLSDPLGTNQQLFNTPASQSDQLAHSTNAVAMQQEQDEVLYQQFVDLTHSSASSVASYPHVSCFSASEIISTSSLSVDTTLAPSTLSHYRHREPQLPFADASYTSSDSSLSSVMPTGTIAQHNMVASQGSTSYAGHGHHMVCPASNLSSSHTRPSSAVYSLPDNLSNVDDGSSGYSHQYVECSRSQSQHSFRSPTGYHSATEMASHPSIKHHHEYVSPSQRLHHYDPSPHQLSPCRQQTSPNPQLRGERYVSPNQALAVNLQPAYSTTQHHCNKDFSPSNQRWIEKGHWESTAAPQWLNVNQSAVSISQNSVSPNQQRASESPLNYSKHSYSSNQHVPNNRMTNNVKALQHMPMSPKELMSPRPQEGTTSASQRRQNTEQTLKECGLYDAAVLSGKLVRRDKEIDSDLTDFKSLLAQFTRSLTVNDP